MQKTHKKESPQLQEKVKEERHIEPRKGGADSRSNSGSVSQFEDVDLDAGAEERAKRNKKKAARDFSNLISGEPEGGGAKSFKEVDEKL
jgi:hypothetical protein